MQVQQLCSYNKNKCAVATASLWVIYQSKQMMVYTPIVNLSYELHNTLLS